MPPIQSRVNFKPEIFLPHWLPKWLSKQGTHFEESSRFFNYSGRQKTELKSSRLPSKMVELTCMLLLTSLLSLIITLEYMYIFMYYFCLSKIQRFHSTFFGSKTLDSAK